MIKLESIVYRNNNTLFRIKHDGNDNPTLEKSNDNGVTWESCKTRREGGKESARKLSWEALEELSPKEYRKNSNTHQNLRNLAKELAREV